MKKKIILLFLFCQLGVFSQSFKGIIEYTASIDTAHVNKFIKDLERNKEVPNHIKTEVIDMYNNAQPENYKLIFLNDESFFSHEGILNVDGSFNMGSKAGTSSFYTNKTKIIEQNILGYIQKTPLKWRITSETKKIGDFNCLKATATEELFSRKGHTYDKEIMAWFTTDIPVSFGPQNYSGLPGLVLELIRDDFTIKATHIDLNPTEEIKIKPPKESKIITQEKANSFIKEMAEENRG